jgi:hypothetical protein
MGRADGSESADCLCDYGFTSSVRKCMYTGCVSEVTAWVEVYRGASCPEGTYSSNTTNPHAAGNSTGNSTTGGGAGRPANPPPSGTSAAAGASASTPAASPTSAATIVGVPVLGAAVVAAVVAAL